MKVGHKAISCGDRTRVHHEPPHRRADYSKEGSPPFLYSDLGGFVAFSSHEGTQGCSKRKTKHVTFATPLTQVCEEQITPVLDNSDLLIGGNMFSVEAPKQSIFSCDPMQYESLIHTPHATTPPSFTTNKILGMLNAATDYEWTSPSQVDQLNPITVTDSSLDETVPNLTSDFPSRTILEDEVQERNHSEQHITTSSTSGISTPPTLMVEQVGPWNLETEAGVSGETLKSGLAVQSVPPSSLQIEVPNNSVQSIKEKCPWSDVTPALGIDDFIVSITRPLPPPLIQQQPSLNLEAQDSDVFNSSTMQSSQHQLPSFVPKEGLPARSPRTPFRKQSKSNPQRKSSRLANKDKSKIGKGTIQVAQELLIKKLGDLSPKLEPSAADQFEQFAQHFDRPLTKANMEALEALVEHGQQLKKKAT